MLMVNTRSGGGLLVYRGDRTLALVEIDQAKSVAGQIRLAISGPDEIKFLRLNPDEMEFVRAMPAPLSESADWVWAVVHKMRGHGQEKAEETA